MLIGTVDFTLDPNDLNNELVIRERIHQTAMFDLPLHFSYKIIRRNIDARNRSVFYVMRADIYEHEDLSQFTHSKFTYKEADPQKSIVIIGAGPCGYFAALQCLRHGIKPIVLDRGKDVRSRRVDLRAIQQHGIVNPNSNYCFGEGGAGTYSDGKLYTRADKRGNIKYVLNILVDHGANPDILVDVHPHIGSNKLPEIVSQIRKTITQYGGEVHFDTCVNDFTIKSNKLVEIHTNQNSFLCEHVILATGHSARDIYSLLDRKNIEIFAKPFALGVRVEHPQSMIDQVQYKQKVRHPNLPAASYSLACQIEEKGVFSFCMCPGGLIVPASTAPGEIVVNGMSLSRRDSPYANSGLVTSVDEIDFQEFSHHKALSGMYYQAHIEKNVFSHSDGTQRVPAQRLTDFIHHKLSGILPNSSYIPGTISSRVDQILPKPVYERLQRGLLQFGKKFKHYLTEEAIVVATESRTSAPVKIPRDPISLMHPQINGLYPAGEGAGYAGGILSAAMDGIKVADAICQRLT